MPFHRYTRLPLSDEPPSDDSCSESSTPQHTLRSSRAAQITTNENAETQSEVNCVKDMQNLHQMSNTNTENIEESVDACTLEDFAPPPLEFGAPPSYSECEHHVSVPVDAVTCITIPTIFQPQDAVPPSYEEVERLKAEEAQHECDPQIALSQLSGDLSACEEGEADNRTSNQQDLLGTDLVFFISFAAAFFFSWVGFVVMVCFCNSVAGRTGALAGVGLSLSKWTLVVKHTIQTKETNSWVLWLIMLLGVVVCLRAVMQYLNAKREWLHASAASRHRFFLFN